MYFKWKDNGKLDYDHEEAIWDKVTGFTASKEALAFLLRQLTDIKNEVPDEDGIRAVSYTHLEERDEIYMALRGILDALPDGTLQKDALMEKFEQLRDF